MLYLIKVSGDLRAYKEIIKEDEHGMVHFTSRIKRHKDTVKTIGDLELEFLSKIMDSNQCLNINVNGNTHKQDKQLRDIIIENIEGAKLYSPNSWSGKYVAKEGYTGYDNFYVSQYFHIEKTEIFNKTAYILQYETDSRYRAEQYVYFEEDGKLERAKVSAICTAIPQSPLTVLEYGNEHGIQVREGECLEIDDRYIFEYNEKKYVLGRSSQLIPLGNGHNGIVALQDFRLYDYEMYGVPTYYMNRTNKRLHISDGILTELRNLRRGYSYPVMPIKKDIEINYIEEYKTDTGISLEYIHDKRLDRFNGDFNNRALRDKFAYVSTIARVLNMIFALPEAVVYTISKNLDYNPDDISRLKIVEGKDITKYYNEKNNVSNGSLGSSCMRYERCKDYFGIYEDNAKMVIQVAVDDKIDLRALIWELTHNDTGEKVTMVDRIYYSNEKDVNKIRAWAENQGWYYIEHNTYGQNHAICKDKHINLADYHVKIADKEYRQYPFLDTFYVRVENRLYVKYSYMSLRSTNGTYSRY